MNIIFLEQTWGLGYGMSFFKQYIEEVHTEYNVVSVDTSNIEQTSIDEEDIIIYEEIHLSRILAKILLLYPKNDIYLHAHYYEILHAKLSHLEYSYEDLVNILKMLSSSDGSIKLLGENILERMPVEYAPFIYLCKLKFSVYNYALYALNKKLSDIKLKNKDLSNLIDFHQIKTMYPQHLNKINKAWIDVFG